MELELNKETKMASQQVSGFVLSVFAFLAPVLQKSVYYHA